MIWTLRIFFVLVLGSMLAVTSWASLRCALFSTPREVFSRRNPGRLVLPGGLVGASIGVYLPA